MRLNEHSGHKTSRVKRAAVPRNNAAWANEELGVGMKLPTRLDERSCRDANKVHAEWRISYAAFAQKQDSSCCSGAQWLLRMVLWKNRAREG